MQTVPYQNISYSSICNQTVPFKHQLLLVYVIEQFPIKTSVTVSICNQTVPYQNISYCLYM